MCWTTCKWSFLMTVLDLSWALSPVHFWLDLDFDLESLDSAEMWQMKWNQHLTQKKKYLAQLTIMELKRVLFRSFYMPHEKDSSSAQRFSWQNVKSQKQGRFFSCFSFTFYLRDLQIHHGWCTNTDHFHLNCRKFKKLFKACPTVVGFLSSRRSHSKSSSCQISRLFSRVFVYHGDSVVWAAIKVIPLDEIYSEGTRITFQLVVPLRLHIIYYVYETEEDI